MPPELHFDPSRLDLNQVLAGPEAIRQVIPQRHEMEQLSAIVYVDPEHHIVAGYKDVRPDEFWSAATCPTTRCCPAC